jgi:enoyl-CoA hydratase/carnithine racemase
MLQQLQDALTSLEDKKSEQRSRCLVLTSSSHKVFSAGADLKERATMSQDQAAAFVTQLRNTMDRLSRLPMPVLASIEGVAVGGGLEIALAADIRIAAKTALLGLPETSLAIVPGAGGTQRLPRLIGVARAKELIFTGRRINGHTAAEYGLVQHLVESGLADRKALELAWEIARNGPVAIQAAKYAIDEGMTADCMTEALEIERQGYERVLPTWDRLEGLKAFNEKRPPVYKGE